MEFIALLWFGIAVVTGIVAGNKGRSFIGWTLLGALFGIFALIVVLVMDPPRTAAEQAVEEKRVQCPDCRELVLSDARVCKHCGCKLVPQADSGVPMAIKAAPETEESA